MILDGNFLSFILVTYQSHFSLRLFIFPYTIVSFCCNIFHVTSFRNPSLLPLSCVLSSRPISATNGPFTQIFFSQTAAFCRAGFTLGVKWRLEFLNPMVGWEAAELSSGLSKMSETIPRPQYIVDAVLRSPVEEVEVS